MGKWAALALCLSAALLAGCAYPVSTVEQGGGHAAIYFPDAPSGAAVIVDGARAVEAAAYDGKHAVLTVEPGTHHVVVQSGATVLMDKVIYVGPDGRRAIVVH